MNLALYVLLLPRTFHQAGLLAFQQSSVFIIQLVWSAAVFALLVWGLYSAMQLTSFSQHSLTSKAETDELTGLINRAGYDRLLEELDLSSTLLLLVDTDKFKGINDRFGSSAHNYDDILNYLGLTTDHIVEAVQTVNSLA